jgi:hypothetical protein
VKGVEERVKANRVQQHISSTIQLSMFIVVTSQQPLAWFQNYRSNIFAPCSSRFLKKFFMFPVESLKWQLDYEVTLTTKRANGDVITSAKEKKQFSSVPHINHIDGDVIDGRWKIIGQPFITIRISRVSNSN